MDQKQLREQVEKLFTKRQSYVALLQELAEHFYPERADFTLNRSIGQNWADYLSTSYPIMVRRELGDQCGQMLRPTAKEWFKMVTNDPGREDNDARQWMEYAGTVMRRAMYDLDAQMDRTMVEADHDYATFGQTVTSVRLNRDHNKLLFRSHHLRDVVWLEDEDGQLSLVAKKWKPTAYDLNRLFPGKVHSQTEQDARLNPFIETNCFHIYVREDLYDGENKRQLPWHSVYIDIAHDHELEAVPTYRCEFDVARWQTVSGSQYAYSPAAITALPEARLIQSMTYTLLEAGEKAANPPLVATDEAVKSDVQIFAGGITWVDMDYDERLGEALRPITQDLKGLPIGIEMQRDSRTLLNHAFYLNKLNLPDRGPEMTAYEVSQRVQEYIRGALPIFAPMEQERNGKTCEAVFDVIMRAGGFGPPTNMPKSLQGSEVHFQFESPLHDMVEQTKSHKFMESKQLIKEATELDGGASLMLDTKVALRDALKGIGTPARWTRPERDVQRLEQQQSQQQQEEREAQLALTGSEAVKNVAGAGAAIAGAQQQ